jgi:tetratricopeptide (TPR) repeat protein
MDMQKTNKSQTWLFAVIVILLVLIAFEPVRHNDFVDYDDPSYITQNYHIRSGFSISSIRWAFTAGYASNWHPLTWLSHMLDIQLFGLNPFWHHLHNVVLHTAAAVLLFLILRQMVPSVWCNLFIVLAFGLHPLRVESVAWASERKDVLSVLLFMITLAFYLYYIRYGGRWRYLAVLSCYALGLMAKPMLVTLPVLLLLLDGWPLRRLQKTSAVRLIAEKLPLFAMSFVSCIVTFLVQQSAGSVSSIPLSTRLLNVITSYTAYLSKLLAPIDLAVIYPYPTGPIPIWSVMISLAILIFWSVFVFYHRRKRPYLLTGWLWYLISLIPVIGLIQVGSQAMADRYTYLPSIGFLLMITCAAAELTASWRHQKWILGCLGGLAIAGMILGTRNQVRYWNNSIILYQHTLRVTTDNYIAESNIAQGLMEQSRFDEAESHILRAFQLRPDYPNANVNMALLCLIKNQTDKAFEFVQRTLQNQPSEANVLYNCGLVLEKLGQSEQALSAYEQAIQCNPDYAAAPNRIGYIKEKQGLFNEACDFYRKSIRANPLQAEGYKNLAWLLAANPAFENHDPKEAVQLAQKACQLTAFREPQALKILAAAYANAGEFEKAVETAQQAVDSANRDGRADFAAEIAEHQQLYQRRRPFRQSPPKSQ